MKIFLQKFYEERFLVIKFMKMILYCPFTTLIHKKIHALVIPKGKYLDLDDFSLNASPEEIVGLIKGINIVAKKLRISTEVGQGYRALANISDHGGQEVHTYIFIYLEVKELGKWLSDRRSKKKLFRDYFS